MLARLVTGAALAGLILGGMVDEVIGRGAAPKARAEPPPMEVNVEDVTVEQQGGGRWCAVPMAGTVDHTKVKKLRAKAQIKTPKAAVIEVKACGKVLASKKGGTRNGSLVTVGFALADVLKACGTGDDGGAAQLEVVPQGMASGVKVGLEFKTQKGAPCAK